MPGRSPLPDVFAALGDAHRRFLLERLSAHGPATATELAHAGLVSSERVGRETQYHVTPAPLEDAIAWMARVGGEWDKRLARLRRHLAR